MRSVPQRTADKDAKFGVDFSSGVIWDNEVRDGPLGLGTGGASSRRASDSIVMVPSGVNLHAFVTCGVDLGI